MRRVFRSRRKGILSINKMSYSAFSSKKVVPVGGDGWQTAGRPRVLAPVALTRASAAAVAPVSSVYVAPSKRAPPPKPFDEEFPTLGLGTKRAAPAPEKKSFSALMKEHAERDAAAANAVEEFDDGMVRLPLGGYKKPIAGHMDKDGMPTNFMVMQRIQERAPSVPLKRRPLDVLEPRDIIGIPSLSTYLRKSNARAAEEYRRRRRLFDSPPESEVEDHYVPEPEPEFDHGSDDEEGHEEAYDADEFNRHRG